MNIIHFYFALKNELQTTGIYFGGNGENVEKMR